jgi:hypothetical protein
MAEVEEKLYRVALREALTEEMERDESIFLIGEDIGTFGGAYRVTEGLLDKFGPKRVVDTPIAEEVIVGTAIGAAMLGLRPVVEMMTINFSLVAYDQIVNNAAKIRYMFGGEVKVPIVIRMPGGAGHQLSAQHSHSFEVLYGLIPGLLVAAPTTPEDAKGLLKSAIRSDNPVMFLESMSLYNVRGDVPTGDYTTPLGKAASRIRRDDRRRVEDGSARERSRQAARGGRHRRRGHRPALDSPRRLASHHRVGAEDEPVRRRRRRLVDVWRNRGDRRGRAGAVLRLPGRPRAASWRGTGANALQHAAGEGVHSHRRGHQAAGARHGRQES